MNKNTYKFFLHEIFDQFNNNVLNEKLWVSDEFRKKYKVSKILNDLLLYLDSKNKQIKRLACNNKDNNFTEQENSLSITNKFIQEAMTDFFKHQLDELTACICGKFLIHIRFTAVCKIADALADDSLRSRLG